MLKSFHHGGRLGDCLYALYTVKNLLKKNEQAIIALSIFQQGNWNKEMAEALVPLLQYQEYIAGIDQSLIDIFSDFSQEEIISWARSHCDYDLHEAELDYNPEKFPEFTGPDWPGNCHIAKRYAVHFGLEFDPEAIWLTAPKKGEFDVVVHAPKRRLKYAPKCMAGIINSLAKDGVRIAIIGGPHDFNEWNEELTKAQAEFICPRDMLEFAAYINGAKVFLGTASSGNVIAEGLKKVRFVELADDCHNTYPFGETGTCINIDPSPKLPISSIISAISSSIKSCL